MILIEGDIDLQRQQRPAQGDSAGRVDRETVADVVRRQGVASGAALRREHTAGNPR